MVPFVYPAVLSPLDTVAITSDPSSAPRTSPRPPKRLTPPMTAAAIAFRSSVPGGNVSATEFTLRREHDAADRCGRARDHEDEHPDARDVDARAPRRLGIAADRIDMPPEGRPPREEGQQDQEDHHDHAGERQPEVVLLDDAVVADRDHAEGGDRHAGQLQGDLPPLPRGGLPPVRASSAQEHGQRRRAPVTIAAISQPGVCEKK